MQPELSLIIPVFNEEDALPQAVPILRGILQEISLPYEIIIIDNGSTDATESIATQIVKESHDCRYIRLSRNFGYQNSLTAAMNMAQGNAIVSIDVDLQDPPELIKTFVEYWQQGYDIVYGIREKRVGESKSRVFATMTALRLIRVMSDYPIPEQAGDFRLISRKVRDAFVQLPEGNRYLRGLVHWLGFKQIGIPYERRGRQFGEQTRGSSNNLWRLIMVVLDAITSSSMKPLRSFLFLGFFVFFLIGVAILIYLILAVLGDPPRGFTTQLIFQLVNIGITAIGFGILGEYIGRIYIETKRRPLWLVDYTLSGIDESVSSDLSTQVQVVNQYSGNSPLTPQAIRRIIIQKSKDARIGHIGSSLCLTEAVVSLYRDIMRLDVDDNDRDRFILSKGHAALAQFAALHLLGIIDDEALAGFYTDGSTLGMHPEHAVYGVDFSTGSLGQGLSFGVGAAMAARAQKSNRKVYVIVSDAECNEGIIWESAMFAAHHKLNNLIVLVDINEQQALGKTKDVINMEPMEDRWSAFGWATHVVDGHDVDLITRTILNINSSATPQPNVILLKTVFAKGIPFMERELLWHYKSMNDEEFANAMNSLETE